MIKNLKMDDKHTIRRVYRALNAIVNDLYLKLFHENKYKSYKQPRVRKMTGASYVMCN